MLKLQIKLGKGSILNDFLRLNISKLSLIWNVFQLSLNQHFSETSVRFENLIYDTSESTKILFIH